MNKDTIKQGIELYNKNIKGHEENKDIEQLKDELRQSLKELGETFNSENIFPTHKFIEVRNKNFKSK